MATKKEKRAAGEVRAAAQREASIASGLQALTIDRAARARQAEKAKLAAEEMEKKLKKAKQTRTHREGVQAMAAVFVTAEI